MEPAAPFIPIQADPKDIVTVNACTRPFRLTGPRIELERRGHLNLIHNYGHGGSGWSLSWGAAAEAVKLARQTDTRQLAVVGCGAIGITTAIEAQQAGFDVTIYAKAQLPQANSAFATGVWSPDSRIVAKAHGDALAPRWQQMARTSFARYQALLGHSAKPVEWLPVYNLSSLPFDKANRYALPGEPDYPHWEAQLLNGLRPADQPLAPGASPFHRPHVRREQLLMFNLSQYGDWLLARFRAAGGRLIAAELSDEQDFARLGSQLVVNCTGFGAKALLGDDALLPVRGQTCRLAPQLAVRYGVRDWDSGVSAYPRRDGVLVQTQAQGDFGAQDATVDLEESRQAVTQLAALMAGMRA